MDQIPTDMILSEQSVRAGLAAMERIHGRHLGDMSAQEQEQAKTHWRDQVEQVLAEPPSDDRGYAVITLSDAGEDRIDVGVVFQPDLNELGNGDVEGTPAQVLALAALEAIASEGEDPEEA
jgi:phenylacetate-coenzyme A ligase PaaK-like adenylate-forming protein